MFRALGQPLVADAGEPKDLGFAGLFVRATRRPRPPIRQCDYYCHSRLHALPETDELAMDFTLLANVRAKRVLQCRDDRTEGIRAFPTALD
ncbi:hypothetical protein HB770_07375 [Rhizobium leguminosarum bv. viciae]|uniref:Uncharacterized protein n=1 Tax=Rhizobium leguminosarum bv. viciae TaxID=387 RepID=A0A7G6RH11_RHILV|nr:hypothetical protein HB770_07375 [Rhizobium leguminosarum bv. viciae]